MAGPRIVPAKCPTCGANLPVPPGVPQVTCRYCQHVITIEHRKAPPEIRPFGSPGVAPSTTLYVDPAAMKRAGGRVGCFVFALILLPVLIPLGIGVGPWGYRSCKGLVKPFPSTCDTNEEIELSGNFESTGPLITTVGHNCKLHIKNSKLKGSMLVKTTISNMEITLENTTIETTDTMIRTGSNLKMKIHGSTLTSLNGMIIDNPAGNVEIQELEASTLESKSSSVIRTKYGLKIHADSSKIRAKKAAIDTESGCELSLKKSCEITSSEEAAVKATSGFKLDAEGGKIDGAAQGIWADSSLSIVATGLTITGKEDAIKTTSSFKLDFTDGTITSKTEAAIDGSSSMDVQLTNSKLNGVTNGIVGSSSFKLKASKKSRIVATSGDGVIGSSGCDFNINDSAIEAGGRAVKLTSSAKVKMNQGARVAGKKGGIEVESSSEVTGTGSTLEGGSAAALTGTYGTKVSFKSGIIKGTPALQLNRSEGVDLEGTKVEGEQKLTK